jgi:hypothetical protein
MNQRTTIFTIGVLFLAPRFALADDATAVVNKAVEVTANSDLRLNRIQNIIRSEKGAFYPPGGEAPAQRTVYLAPERIKYEAVMTGGGRRDPILISVSGVRGWKLQNGSVEDVSVILHDSIRDEADVWTLITLRGLRQKDVKLRLLPGTTIDKKPAVGVNISRPDRRDAQMYFDTQTGLPVKLAVKVREAGLDVNREFAFGGYEKFDGIKLPTKITVTQNGRKIEDWTVTDYKFPDKIEDKVFEKPR